MKKPTHKRRSSSRTARESLRHSQRRSIPALNRPAELSDVLATPKLLSRRRRPIVENENAALRTLVRVMAEDPDALVDALLNAAMELCDAGTAGLSIVETTSSGDKAFRWTHVAGKLRQFFGASSPADFSPFGVTIEQNSPQLFLYPARYFHYLADVQPPIIEALVLPVRMSNGTPCTIWIVSHDPKVHFDAEDARIMTALADFTSSALFVLRCRDQEKRDRAVTRSEAAAHHETAASQRDVQASLEAEVRTRTQQLQVLSARLIANQDEERRRLARELHDSAGQYLSAILMQLAAAIRDSDPAVRNAKISEAMEMANRCNSEIRTISYLLHPPLLDELGLRSAISMYVEGFAKRSGIQVDLQIPESLGRLPVSVETTLFRVVQQSLSNIYRHSGSSSARIEIELDAENVTVNIYDQGSGISANTLEEFNTGKSLLGVGVAGMRERIRDMKGRFDISSSKKGTTVQVVLPVS